MASNIIPLFPLNLVSFPGEKLNLHIFEPRYRQLIKECDEEGITFVICPHYNGKNIPIGTEMKLLDIEKKYKTGKMDIRTEGIGLVKIHAFYKTIIGKLYPGAEVEHLYWDSNSEIEKNKEILSLIKELYKLMLIDDGKLISPLEFRTFMIAHKVGFNYQQEIEFLKIGKETERQDYLLKHLQNIIPIVKEMEAMKLKAKLNGHFKNVIPPEF